MYTIFKIFIKEIIDSIEQFCKFSKNHKGVIILLIVVLCLLYGQRICYYDISIDSEIAISSQKTILESWLAIDRFGLVLTKFIFGLSRFVPQASNILMVLTLGFSAFFFDFCINEWVGGDRNYQTFYYVFPISYVSAPCLAEQFYFSLQSFEIAWAGLLCIMAVYCISKCIILKESILWIFLGMCLMVWSFASYQVFVALFIAITLICFLMYYINYEIKITKESEWIFIGFKFSAIAIIGLLLYKLIAKIVKLYYHLNSTYVDDMFAWKRLGVSGVINNIKGDFYRIYLGTWDTFFQKLFLPALFFCVLILLFRGYIMHRKVYILFVIAISLLVISPLFLTIVSGSYQFIRGQLVYPLVYAFCLALVTTVDKKFFATVCCIIAFFGIIYQGQIMIQLFHTAYITYEQDKKMAVLLCEDIENVGREAGLKEYAVIFVGKKKAILPEDARIGEVIGHSFFEWDSSQYAGSTNRIIGFCRTLGYRKMAEPSKEQAEEAKKIAKKMSIWPKTNSVREINGSIVIKLSNK